MPVGDPTMTRAILRERITIREARLEEASDVEILCEVLDSYLCREAVIADTSSGG